jgi:VirE N-terminal domain
MFNATLANTPINLFHGSFDSEPKRTVTLTHILESIRTGSYARQVRHVREILVTQGKGAYDKAKAYLPAVTFGGVFLPSRGNAHLQKHNGLAHGDLDHLPDVAAVKQALAADPRTVYVFISPSGTGLKVGVHVPIVGDDVAYKRAWAAVAAEYERLQSSSELPLPQCGMKPAHPGCTRLKSHHGGQRQNASLRRLRTKAFTSAALHRSRESASLRTNVNNVLTRFAALRYRMGPVW